MTTALVLGLLLQAIGVESRTATPTTKVGSLNVRLVTPRVRDPFTLRLEFRNDADRLLLAKQLSTGGPYGVSVWQPAVEGLPKDSLVAVSGWMAGDRIVFEPFFFALVDDHLRELRLKLPALKHSDAACLHDATHNRPLLLTIIESGAGRCVVCWPKEFTLVRYSFDGAQFQERWRFTSVKEFESADAAMKHYGVPCAVELISAANDHVIASGPKQ